MPGWFSRLVTDAYGLIGVVEGNGEWYCDHALPDATREYQRLAIEVIDEILLRVDWFVE